mgnify:CR=1 FL=1|tara:strand:- start:2391 stop:2819 length:429 start_codon:yes stop_codon:yes gene_type:complete
MNFIYIILNDKNNILGIFKDLNISISNVLDNYILQFNIINDLAHNNSHIKLNNIQNFKIIERVIDTNIISNEIIFCLNKYIFIDINLKSNYLNDNLFDNKINNIKLLHKNILKYIDQQNNLNVFIPNCDIINNEIKALNVDD